MRNIIFRITPILVCFFIIVSCSHEKQFTQKKYDKLQKLAVNSKGTNYCKSNKISETPEQVNNIETENNISDKTGELLSYAPENKTNISTPYEETLIPFILKKATKKLSVSNFTDVKKQNYIHPTVKKSDKKTAPRRGYDVWNIVIIVIVVSAIVIGAYLIYKSS